MSFLECIGTHMLICGKHTPHMCRKSSCTLCGSVQSLSTCVAVYKVFQHFVWLCTKSFYMCGCVQSLPALCVAVYKVFLQFVWLCTKSSCTCVAVYRVFLHVWLCTKSSCTLSCTLSCTAWLCMKSSYTLSNTTWLCMKSSYALSCTT